MAVTKPFQITLSVGRDKRFYGENLNKALREFGRVPYAARRAWQIEVESQIGTLKTMLIKKIRSAGQGKALSSFGKKMRAWYSARGYPAAGSNALEHTGKMIREGLVANKAGRMRPSEWHVSIGISKKHKSHVGTSAGSRLSYAEIAGIIQAGKTVVLTKSMMRWFQAIDSGKGPKGAKLEKDDTQVGTYRIPPRPFMIKFQKDAEKLIRARLKKKGLDRLSFSLMSARVG